MCSKCAIKARLSHWFVVYSLFTVSLLMRRFAATEYGCQSIGERRHRALCGGACQDVRLRGAVMIVEQDTTSWPSTSCSSA